MFIAGSNFGIANYNVHNGSHSAELQRAGREGWRGAEEGDREMEGGGEGEREREGGGV